MTRRPPESKTLNRAVFCGLRFAILVVLLGLAIQTDAQAQSISCPLSAQKPMLLFQMFFGRSVPNRGPVTSREWNAFLRQSVKMCIRDRCSAIVTVLPVGGRW